MTEVRALRLLLVVSAICLAVACSSRKSAEIEQVRPVKTVVVASVPDVRRLWEVGHKDAQAVGIWKTYRICPSMLADPQSTSPQDEARRAAVARRIAAYDAALKAECAAASKRSSATTCHYDDGAVTRSRFTLADVSTIDYFHPSPSGQARLAEVVAAATGIPS